MKIRVPKVGEKFHFFDDGKSSPSRHYIATITDVKKFDDLSETLQNEIKEEQKQCYWLYAKETDYVLKGVLNNSNIEPLYFIRTTDGRWFSIGFWAGKLDIDGFKFKTIIDDEFKYFNYKTRYEAEYAYNKQSGLTLEDLEGVIEYE